MTRRSNTGERKISQCKVDKALLKIAQTNPDALEEWNLLLKYNANHSDLKKFLEEHNQWGISTMNISVWYAKNRPRGNQAIAMNGIAEAFKGIEPDSLNDMAVTLTAKIAHQLYKSLSEEDIERSSSNSKISNLIEALKELRINSSEQGNKNVNLHAKQLKLEGALIVADKLKEVFKESHFIEGLCIAIDEILEDFN